MRVPGLPVGLVVYCVHPTVLVPAAVCHISTCTHAAYLRAPLETITTDGRRHLTRNKLDRSVEYLINSWDLSVQERQDIHDCISKLTALSTHQPPEPNSRHAIVLTDEGATNGRFYIAACERVNNVLKDLKIPYAWEMNSTVIPSPLSHGKPSGKIVTPDFKLVHACPTSKPLLYGEGKYTSMFNVHDLEGAYQDRETIGHNAYKCAVDQECRFMASINAPFGFLTTYERTYFLKLVSYDKYDITEAFYASNTAPSVPEMLYWITHKRLCTEKRLGWNIPNGGESGGSSVTSANATTEKIKDQAA